MQYFLTFFLVLFSALGQASVNDSINIPKVEAQKFDTLFSKIVKESESYKDLKLIKNSDLDIISTAHKADVASYKSTIISLQEDIDQLKQEVSAKIDVVEEDREVTGSVDTINTLLILIGVGVLLVLVIVFTIFQNKKLKETLNLNKSSLESLENEFDEFKRSAMERELKVKRELLNERNKNNQEL